MVIKKTRRTSRARPSFAVESFLDSAGTARRIVKLPKNATVFAQGDMADEVFYVQQGSVKLSVLDGEGVLVLVAAQGRRPYALGVTPGQRMPINAGAAGKLLFAFEPPERQVDWLARPLAAFTSRTVTDPKRLKAEAARIRRQGWAQDRGESAPSIYAYAAPIRDHGGQVLAALSIPFLHGTESEQAEDIRVTVISLADEISTALLG